MYTFAVDERLVINSLQKHLRSPEVHCVEERFSAWVLRGKTLTKARKEQRERVIDLQPYVWGMTAYSRRHKPFAR